MSRSKGTESNKRKSAAAKPKRKPAAKGKRSPGGSKNGSDATPAEATEKARKPKHPEIVALGNRVRRLRDDAGLTQEQVADQAGLHWSYVGQIERGERNLTYRNVLRIARGLEVRPGRVVQDDSE